MADVTSPKLLLLAAALALCARPAAAYRFDNALGAELAAEFRKAITATETGAQVYARLESTGPAGGAFAPPAVLLRHDASGWLAQYDADRNVIYFNSRSVAKFFAAGKMKPSRIVEALHRKADARAAFVSRADALYLHELVHAVQRRLYPGWRGAAGGNPVELEYEAYLTEDLYFHEKMKKAPALLRAFIRGSDYDLYSDNTMGTYLMASAGMEGYRDRIRKKYERDAEGYSSFARNVAAQRNALEESRIMAYAAGRVADFKGDAAALGRLEAEKEAYAAFLNDLYGRRWPEYSADALFFVGTAALEEKNYPLALDCLAAAAQAAAAAGAPALHDKAWAAVLEASAFIKDKRGKMTLDILAQHLKAVEKACLKTGLPLPDGFAGLRAEVYPKAFRYYAGRAAAEKDADRKEYCEENAGYFSDAAGEGQR